MRRHSSPTSRAGKFARYFAGQWLYLRNLRAASPDPYVFPDFDDNYAPVSAVRETELCSRP
jgi:hypothetical protein